MMPNEASSVPVTSKRPSEEEIARKRAERAARKLEKERQAKEGTATSNQPLGFRPRQWAEIKSDGTSQSSSSRPTKLRIMTWNVRRRPCNC
jgi:hypothetical protein